MVALYFLIDKKVIANPFTYLFPSTPSSLGSLGSPESPGSRESLGSTDSDTPSDDTPSTYTDRLSPNKKIKARYIKVAQTVINTDAARTIWCDTFRCGDFFSDTNNAYIHRLPNKPIKLSSIRVYDKDGEVMNLYSSNVSASYPGNTADSIANLVDEETYGEDGNMVYTEFTTELASTPSWQSEPDYLIIDLQREMTISEVSLEARSTSAFVDYNMVGVYLEMRSGGNKPIARTPIITTPGRVFNFKFPGTSWDIEDAVDVEFE